MILLTIRTVQGVIRMIYTVGKEELYELYFYKQGSPRKMGRTDTYPGGSVWKTKEEAEKFCKEGYKVYGVEADWDRDTEKSENGDCHDLLVSSYLVRI